MNERTHLDLFSGIGGFALAARANGVRTIAFCEIDARCRAFLAKAWPGVPVWDDIRTFAMAKPQRRGSDGQTISVCRERPEAISLPAGGVKSIWLLTGGVPCQPASRAGKQRGKEDDRWLWPEAVRVIAAVKPTWALLENPPGIGDVGLAGILSEVEAQGYEVRVLSIPACAVGAPHRRERFWIVAHSRCLGSGQDESGRRQDKRTADGGIVEELAHAPERGQREHGGAPGQCGHPDQCGQGGLGNAKISRGGTGLGQGEPQQNGNGVASTSAWSDFVWLPCADGKVRRAPDGLVGVADGDTDSVLAELATVHRSGLGALGNAIVWPVAAKIIESMIESESNEDPLPSAP